LDSTDLRPGPDLFLQLGVEPLDLLLVGAADLGLDEVEYLLLQLIVLALLVLLESELFLGNRLLLLASLLEVETACSTSGILLLVLLLLVLSLLVLLLLLRSSVLSLIRGATLLVLRGTAGCRGVTRSCSNFIQIVIFLLLI
jgi:hypothetical protein